MKVKVLVKFEGVVGYPNNSYKTVVSAEGVDKSECYKNVHQRCMNIVGEIDRDQHGLGHSSYMWIDEEWE